MQGFLRLGVDEALLFLLVLLLISVRLLFESGPEIGILLPNNQRQHRTLHIQRDLLPYALC